MLVIIVADVGEAVEILIIITSSNLFKIDK